MICPDCATNADWQVPTMYRWRQRAELSNVERAEAIERSLSGHDRCFERNLGKPSPDCACQHRSPSEVSDGR